MPFGFPLRTRNTIVDVYGALLCGNRVCQLSGRSFAMRAISSMSYASASVTTSASRPSITLRACLPDPPWDCLMTIFSPVLACHCRAKSALISLYSSRVGSYETLRSVTSARAAGAAAIAAERSNIGRIVEMCI